MEGTVAGRAASPGSIWHHSSGESRSSSSGVGLRLHDGRACQDGSNHQITCWEKNIRIVLCGNLVRPADHAKPVDAGVQAMVIYDRELMKELEVQRLQIAWNVVPGESPDQTDLYAGGIDSTALRCTLRKLTWGMPSCLFPGRNSDDLFW